MLSIAKEIIEMNRRGEKPEDLTDPDIEEVIAGPDYTDMVGQDSLTRMDHKKKKKKKKNRNKNKGGNRPPGQASNPNVKP